MGDQRGKPEGRTVPGGVKRAMEIMRPLVVKGLGVARALPGRSRALMERADLPRRLAQGRNWVVEKDFPANARKVADRAAQTGFAAADFSQKMAAAATARLGPVATAAGAAVAGAAKSLIAAWSHRLAAFSATLNEKRALAVRKRERKAVAKSAKALEPVPSELMRLLKEEGVEVEGMDVREALPEPVRPMPVQGVLPLFADETSPLPGKSR